MAIRQLSSQLTLQFHDVLEYTLSCKFRNEIIDNQYISPGRIRPLRYLIGGGGDDGSDDDHEILDPVVHVYYSPSLRSRSTQNILAVPRCREIRLGNFWSRAREAQK